jgi:hypothetical protein
VVVVLAFRVAIVVAPLTLRVVQSGQPSALQQGGFVAEALWRRFNDPGEADEDLSVAASEQLGYSVAVTTFSGEFSCRKLQVAFSFGAEDVRVVTHHFLKVAGGVPSDAWVAADFVTVEDAYDVFFAAMKDTLPPAYVLAGLRWYKAGPNDVPPQEPVRVVERSVAGTSIFSSVPPQCAASVTEKTTSSRAWGRFYFPAPGANGAHYTGTGRFQPSYQTQLGNAADAMYESCLAAGITPVVYSVAKPVRPTAAGGQLPAIGARALSIDQLQVDDIPDVIRSRRHNTPLLRLLRAVGA